MTNQTPSVQGENERHGFNAVETLSDDYLNTLVAELNNDNIVGIILGGSYARNEATPFSDVDITCFVSDSMKPPPKRFIYGDGRLLSIGYRTVADTRSELTRSERDIFIVSGFRRVLLDKDGSISRLMREIETFKWGSVESRKVVPIHFPESLTKLCRSSCEHIVSLGNPESCT